MQHARVRPAGHQGTQAPPQARRGACRRRDRLAAPASLSTVHAHRTVDSATLSRRMAGSSPPLVLAVMSASDHRSARIPNSRLLGDPAELVREVPLDRAVVVSCRSPGDLTASWACRLLVEHGFRDVSIHIGGLRAWEAAGLPVDRDR